MQIDETNCPVKATMDIIGGKWKPIILYYLKGETRRFGELQRLIPHITKKMLTQQLRELEQDKIVTRKVYPQVPPKVEYSLAEYGKSLKSVLESMAKWGTNHLSLKKKKKKQSH
ncbi:MAG: winged helix-turn-helix transcriptional regulator [Pyrinomonadaceae bacterium]